MPITQTSLFRHFSAKSAAFALVAALVAAALSGAPAGAFGIGGATVTVTAPSTAVLGPSGSCNISTNTTYYCVPAGTSSVTFQLTDSGGIQLPLAYSSTNSSTGAGQFTSVPQSVSLTPANSNAGQQMTFSVALTQVVTVYFTQQTPTIRFNSNPFSFPAGTIATITGTVVDQTGQPIAGAQISGQIVAGANYGFQAVGNGTTNAQGQFAITYNDARSTASNNEDNIQVTAVTPAGVRTSSNVYVQWNNNTNTGSLSNLLFNGVAVGSFGGALQVAAQVPLVVGQNAAAVSVATPFPNGQVTFTTSGGGMLVTPNGQVGQGQKSLTVNASGPTATVWFFSTQAGQMPVIATSGNSLSGNITFQANPATARNVSLATSSAVVAAGGTFNAIATVTDGFGNAVGAGVPINFAVNSAVGTFAGGAKFTSAITNTAGQAVVPVVTSARESGAVVLSASGSGYQFGLPAANPVPFFGTSSPSAGAQVTLSASGSQQRAGVQVPSSVKPGKPFTVKITGFPATQRVQITLNRGNAVISTKFVTTSNSGLGQTSFTASKAGTYRVIASDTSGNVSADKQVKVK